MFEDAKKEYDKKYNKGLKKAGIFFAFGDQQFEENKTHKKAPDSEYISIGSGGYFHKSNKSKVYNFFNVELPEIREEFLNKIKMEDLIEYELVNHECYYTESIMPVAGIVSSYYNMPIGEVYKKVQELYDATKHKNIGI